MNVNWSASLNQLKGTEAIVVILERGYSESFARENARADPDFWGPRLLRWLDSDADFGLIVSTRPRNGYSSFKTGLIYRREALADSLRLVSESLADTIGGGKRIGWLQGDTLGAGTQELLREVLGELPSAWQLN